MTTKVTPSKGGVKRRVPFGPALWLDCPQCDRPVIPPIRVGPFEYWDEVGFYGIHQRPRRCENCKAKVGVRYADPEDHGGIESYVIQERR